jgi:hypothetical protein
MADQIYSSLQERFKTVIQNQAEDLEELEDAQTNAIDFD